MPTRLVSYPRLELCRCLSLSSPRSRGGSQAIRERTQESLLLALKIRVASARSRVVADVSASSIPRLNGLLSKKLPTFFLVVDQRLQ